MTPAVFAVIFAATLIGACVQASIGFGLGMLVAPVVVLIAPDLMPATIIMMGAVVTLVVTAHEGRHIDLRGTGWALAGRFPGTVAGTALVVLLPASGLSLVLAATVVLGVVLAIRGWRPVPHRRNLVVAGLASGVLGTATSIGGPPMSLVLHGLSGARLRSTMSGFLLVGSVVSVLSLAAAGAVGRDALLACLALAPAIVLGYLASRYVNRFMTPLRLRYAAISVSLLGAAALIVREVVLLAF